MSTPTSPSRCVLTARAMFGLVGDVDPLPLSHLRRAAASILDDLEPGQIALVTGPSGSGKSSLAGVIADLARERGVPVVVAPDPMWRAAAARDATPVDLLTGPVGARLSTLAAVGLADARLFVRPVQHLSVGERARLSIAMAFDAMWRWPSEPAPVIILDELASTLDRASAMRLARLLRRRVGAGQSARLVCLTAHDDLAGSLRPDHHVHVTPGPRVRRRVVGGAGAPERGLDLVHERGTFADYAALASHHYRGGRPAMLAGSGAIRVARLGATGEVVGVLVVSMPTLNGPWRAVAWPGVFDTPDPRENARRLSKDLRTIARVVVAPEHRGLGVATAMVRHYLARPMTPATEALAAMGMASPFFAAAGMRPCPRPPTAREARLLDALAHLGLAPGALLTLGALPVFDGALLTRELRHWGTRSRATRGVTDLERLGRLAASSLLAPPVAYAHADPIAWRRDHPLVDRPRPAHLKEDAHDRRRAA